MEELLSTALGNALAATALGAAVAALTPLLARRPAVLHFLWVVVLLKLATPPLIGVPIALPASEPEAQAVAPGPEDLEAVAIEVGTEDFAAGWDAEAEGPDEAAAAPPPPHRWSIDAALAWKALGFLWLAGSAATALLAAVRVVRFGRVLREASPAGYAAEDEVAALAAEMGIRRPPLVDLIDARTTPMLWGLGLRPRLILPRMLWKGLDGRSRTLLLAHELAHLKRGDHLLRFFELAVTVLYWWLPTVWWVRRALRDAEEQCCDAWVVSMFPDDARAYAETLLDTVDFLNPSADPEPLLASGFGKVRHLRKRLTMVMNGKTPRALGWRGALGAFALAGVLLPMSPTLAQKTEEAAVTFERVIPSELVFVGEPADGKDATITVRTQDGEVQTVNVAGTTLVSLDDDEKAKKDKDKDKSDEKETKSEPPHQLRMEVRASTEEGLQKAAEKLEGRIKELEDKKPEGEAGEAQIKALKAALEQIQKMAKAQKEGGRAATFKGGGQSFSFSGGPKGDMKVEAPRVVVARRLKADDPKAVEARKQIDELRKVLAEKQKEMSEAARKLAQAQAELAKLGGDVFTFKPDVTSQLKEVRPFDVEKGPRIAQGLLLQPGQPDSKDKARIDALEQKLDKVLKELEGLKKPQSDDDDKRQRN